MPLEFIIILGLALLLILILYLEPIFNKYKIKNDNEYGSARFSTFKEIKKNFNKEKVSSINNIGFPVYYSKNNKYVWFDNQTPHYVYLGSTGCGKSSTVVIPMCSFIATAKNKQSVFITDPKGEIFQYTSKMFEENGYKIITIDFRNPELSNKINLLEPVIVEYDEYIKYEKEKDECKSKISSNKLSIENLKTELELFKTQPETFSDINIPENIKYKQSEIERLQNEIKTYENNLLLTNNLMMKHLAETNRLITSLSTMITAESTPQKDPFWNNSAKNLLEGLIGLFLEEYKDNNISREQITLTSIKKFQSSSMEEENFEILNDYINQKSYGLKSKDSLTSILSASENTYKSITAVFGEKMSLFDDINVANITSSSDFKFDILGNEKTALYVIVPDEDKTYYTLITIIIGMLYRELVKLANAQKDKKLPVRIQWILDEFANCPPLDSIEALVSVARSRGMNFSFFIQSFSQLDQVYGKEIAQIILDNSGLVYLKTNTQSCAETISKYLGKKTISSDSISQSMNNVNINGNKSTSLMGRDLFTPEEIKQLHYKTIIFPTIGYPIFRDTVLYNKFSCFKNGEICRNSKSLDDLSHTYFTVEDIKKRLADNNQTDTNNQEANMMLNDKIEFDKNILKQAISQIEEIMKNTKQHTVNFHEVNNGVYAEIIFPFKICGMDKDKIIKSIDTNLFVIKISIKESNNTTIEIHKNGIG